MYVKCTKNAASSIGDEVVGLLELNREKNFDIEVGESYIVYSMCLVRGVIKYLIYSETGKIVFGWYPAFLFDIVDCRVSKLWKVWHRSEYSGKYVQTIWGYSELVEDMSYFTSLVDQERDALRVFSEYRKMMDLEFDIGLSHASATFIENNWLMCGNCDNAFEDNATLNELVKCPSCEYLLKKMQN